ncbi:Glycosyl hydrolase family 67 N-terminus [Chryseobacterium shigense]|uniref:Glycosyl hydrolase family 67 N-terminus n=1 Tax=Chryseobacterium shigense TaxID=297244 RepID=A0A1N7IKM8_9FLAO|nr:DUF4838 domain-containing protein [Chryseobacterium shigense]SIS37531.1 Glycosyl hydrolase family 67 N-terminus [Chryseobacterium shigense]
MNSIKVLFFIFLLAVNCNLNSQTLVLADDGQSKYKIIVALNADKNEIFAASEFQRYFENITGIKLAVEKNKGFENKYSIFVGNRNRFENIPSVEDDGVILQTKESNLIISGGKNRGVLYSVYSFFENYLDCEFFALDEIKIPKKRSVSIPQLNYIYSPVFNFRSYYSLENSNKAYADFHKQNYFFENRLYPAHSLAWLLPAEKYFKTHPEYFALIDGKRNPSQICFSSEGALNELLKVLKHEMEVTPNEVWSVSHLDSPNYCHCNICENKYKRGNGFSETLIPFVNKVAKAFPDKTISTLAYNQSLLPSKFELPAKNVEIMFCFTNVDRRYAINSDKNKEAKRFIDALQDWKKQTSNIFIWDYNVNYFHSLFPFPNLNTLKQNITYFKNTGAKKVFIEGIGPQQGEFSELKSYVASKLLWNPNADYDLLMNEFLMNYYGEAWKDIKQYIQTLEVNVQKYNNPLDVYANPVQYKNGYLSEQNILIYKNILEKALDKVKTKPQYINRIKKEMLSIEYAELEIYSNAVNARSDKSSNEKFNRKLNSFKQEAKKLNITYLRNAEFTVDEFIKTKSR